jgi:NADH dehydrogenase
VVLNQVAITPFMLKMGLVRSQTALKALVPASITAAPPSATAPAAASEAALIASATVSAAASDAAETASVLPKRSSAAPNRSSAAEAAAATSSLAPETASAAAAADADAISGASDEVVEEVVDALSAASDEVMETVIETTEDLFSDADVVSGASDEVMETVVDTLSAASDAVADTGGTVVEAGTRAFKAVWDLTKPIFSVNGVIATWFRTTFMDGIMAYIPYQGFQLGVVLAEIAIGLMMIGGLFTWWAAVISIVMCLVFTLSGMFAWNQVWFLFAGFLLMGGAGRAFGLDCWVVPIFKKWWNGTRFARKRYWYLDGPSK